MPKLLQQILSCRECLRARRLAFLPGILLCVSALLNAQTLTWVSQPNSGCADGYAYGVSADGRVVVGEFRPSGYWHAFRWDNGVLLDLGTLGGLESVALDVSADGNIVVGFSGSASGGRRAFRWENGLMLDIVGSGSLAEAVSADGSTVAGSFHTGSYWHAFRWRNGVTQDLGYIAWNLSWAHDVSTDGSVVVGTSGGRAFRWVEGQGMQDLGTLPEFEGGYWLMSATAVSADGSVIVGAALHAHSGLRYILRWTVSQGIEIENLGIFGDDTGYNGGVNDVSADGRIIVGTADINGHLWAFRWTEGQGMENLNQTYAHLLTDGSQLLAAYAISPDGRYIAGKGYNAGSGCFEAFLIDTWLFGRLGDTNGDNRIDDIDLLNVLFAFGTAGTEPTRHEDINKDGIVDDADLIIVLFNFGR